MTDKESQPLDNSGGAPDLTPVKTERAGIPRDRTKQNRTEPDIFEVKIFCSVFNMTKLSYCSVHANHWDSQNSRYK